MGNLRTAKWYFLMTNPGYDGTEYHEEEVPAFRTALKNNMLQDNFDTEYPFLSLNPEFSWTVGFKYWYGLLCKNNHISLEKLKRMAKEVAVIQLYGFHSAKSPLIPKNFKNLPFELIEWLHNENPDRQFVISRKKSAWSSIERLCDKQNIKFDSNQRAFIPSAFYEEYGI